MHEAALSPANQPTDYYTKKGDTMYAIHWGWPGDEAAIPNTSVKPGGTARMLGVEGPLEWQRRGDNLIVRMPATQPCRYAVSIAIQADLSEGSDR
jgi:hypothetical protein